MSKNVLFDSELRQATIFQQLSKRKEIDVAGARELFQSSFYNEKAELATREHDLKMVKMFLSDRFKSLYNEVKCDHVVHLPPLLVMYSGNKDVSFGVNVDEYGGLAESTTDIPDLFLHFHAGSALITLTICGSKVQLFPKYKMVLETIYSMKSKEAMDIPTFFKHYERMREYVFSQKLIF